jgi:shikimate dehydrogenase
VVEEEYRGVHARALSFSDPLPPARILVNASPLGMKDYPTFPLALDLIEEGGVVFDLVYTPLETELLKAARARGLRTIDGLAMLIAQAAPAFELFFGVPAPREHDEALRELLTS